MMLSFPDNLLQWDTANCTVPVPERKQLCEELNVTYLDYVSAEVQPTGPSRNLVIDGKRVEWKAPYVSLDDPFCFIL